MVKIESFIHTDLDELTKEINEWLFNHSMYKIVNISYSSCVYKRSDPLRTPAIEFEYSAMVAYDDGRTYEYVQLEEKCNQMYNKMVSDVVRTSLSK